MLKNLVISTALILGFSFSASADVSDILAQKVVTGGFVKQAPHGVRILRSGLVESFSGAEVHVLGELYLTSKDEMVSLIEKSTSQLEDLNPQSPSCVDDVTTQYIAYRTTGEEMAVAKRVRCHNYVSQNLMTIKNMLDGFSALDKTPFKPIPFAQ